MALNWDYLARERALQMAQQDLHRGAISADEVVPRARQYEAYLSGKPILAALATEDDPTTLSLLEHRRE